jgi:hypothetical protein
MDRRDRMNQTRRWYDAFNKAEAKATVSDRVIDAVQDLQDDGQADPNGLTADALLEQPVIAVTFVVCPTCDGRGVHVNPSIDAHGISADEFAEDPDFAEAYHKGVYDVSCYECNGASVIPVPVDPNVKKAIEALEDFERDCMAEQEAERRMGA